MDIFLARYKGKRLKMSRTINSELLRQAQEQYDSGHINSFYRYRSTLRAIERFSGDNIHYQDITPNWLQKCEEYWLSEDKSTTTINIYMKALKKVMNKALDEGIISKEKYPFSRSGYKIPPSQSRRLALSKEEISKIASYSGKRSLERYRDLWMFSYLCNGINFRDMLYLQYRNVRGGEIVFTRSKTKHSSKELREIHAVITKEMQDILDSWGNPPDGDQETYLFKYAHKGQSPKEVDSTVRKVTALCNKALKEIAEEIGIEPFSTYSARHSFATILSRSGVDVAYISECLGHTSLQVTKTYLAGFEKEDRERYSKILTDF